jgi:lipid II:glycine glycyltransferase (peptidoglycan interpeptide bridge formation enzyme)
MPNQYRMRPTRDETEWNELFSAVGAPRLVQTWAYGEGKRAVGWNVRRTIFERDGEPVAISHVFDKKVAGVALPVSRINRGPLLIGKEPDDGVVEGVHLVLRRHWQRLRHGVLFLAPALEASEEHDQLLRDMGFRDRGVLGRSSVVLDLTLDEDRLRANLASSWRNRLKAAEKAGLTFTVSESEEMRKWLLERHEQNIREKEFHGQPPVQVDAFCCSSPGDYFIGCVHLGDEAVATMLVCLFADSAECHVGWFGSVGRPVSAGNFLYWQMALEAKRRGCRSLDLGGFARTDPQGLRHFKQGMRGAEYTLMDEWMSF